MIVDRAVGPEKYRSALFVVVVQFRLVVVPCLFVAQDEYVSLSSDDAIAQGEFEVGEELVVQSDIPLVAAAFAALPHRIGGALKNGSVIFHIGEKNQIDATIGDSGHPFVVFVDVKSQRSANLLEI